jgi:GDPmannose 4,6-dehydratase
MTTAIVVGSGGQDGTLLSAHLRARGVDVHGIAKPERDVARIVAETNPDEVYYLAAFHHSSQDPPIDPGELLARSTEVHVTNLARWLDAIRARPTRLFYAASSLLFGDPVESPQTERTPMNPTEAYGVTKLAGMTLCHEYRSNGVFASVGILYNHESPLRAVKFVSKKIVKAAWAIRRGEQEKLVLGSLDAALDWGYAPDFVDAMQRILALPAADDFIVATGELHSVREFVELAFGQLGLDWRAHVEENPSVITRPPLARVGDASKLTRMTGWRPSKGFAEMVRALMDAEA